MRKSFPPPLSQEKVQLIRKYLNHRPRTEAARLCGVSMRCFYLYAKKYGCEIDHSRSTANDYYRQITAEHYADMTAGEIQQAYGVPRGKANEWARRLGIRHNPETQRRIEEKLAEARSLSHTPEVKRRAAEKWKKKRRTDQLRLLSGLPQLTKFRFTKYPKAIYKAIWSLERKYNYFRDEEVGGLYTIYYDADTRRTKMEHLYTKRYGLKFQEA